MSTAVAQQDVISTKIGGGPSGMPALDANLNGPSGVSLDTSGNYYIANQYQLKVFKVSSTGQLSLVAGTGFSGYSGDGVVGGATGAATWHARQIPRVCRRSERRVLSRGTHGKLVHIQPAPGDQPRRFQFASRGGIVR